MAHYSVSDKLSASARFEYARNGDPTHVKLIEGTVGLGVPLGGRFEFRPEVRVDNASLPNFDDAAGIARTRRRSPAPPLSSPGSSRLVIHSES